MVLLARYVGYKKRHIYFFRLLDIFYYIYPSISSHNYFLIITYTLLCFRAQPWNNITVACYCCGRYWTYLLWLMQCYNKHKHVLNTYILSILKTCLLSTRTLITWLASTNKTLEKLVARWLWRISVPMSRNSLGNPSPKILEALDATRRPISQTMTIIMQWKITAKDQCALSKMGNGSNGLAPCWNSGNDMAQVNISIFIFWPSYSGLK